MIKINFNKNHLFDSYKFASEQRRGDWIVCNAVKQNAVKRISNKERTHQNLQWFGHSDLRPLLIPPPLRLPKSTKGLPLIGKDQPPLYSTFSFSWVQEITLTSHSFTSIPSHTSLRTNSKHQEEGTQSLVEFTQFFS